MNYQIDDVVAGRCTMNEVGTPKPEVILEPSAKDQILEDLVANSITPKTQAGFNKWAESNPGLYYPMLAKHNLARLAKEEAPKLPDLNTLTLQDMEALSSAEIKLLLLKDVAVSKSSELEALRQAPSAEG